MFWSVIVLHVKINGLEDLIKKLGEMKAKTSVKLIVKQNGAALQSKMERNAVFVKGYSTGQTKRSIPVGAGFRDDGMTAYAGPTTDYAPYLEYGTRFMSAQPFVKPAWEVQKEQFKSDMRRLVGR